MAETFAALWKPYATRTMAHSKRVHSDPKWKANQDAWPIHRKWMKELYEARSSKAHRGPKAGFQQNWADWQHMIVAAFVYPLVIKLRLMKAGLYDLDDEELGACEALDVLLDSDWGKGWRKTTRVAGDPLQAGAVTGWNKLMERVFAEDEVRPRTVKVRSKYGCSHNRC